MQLGEIKNVGDTVRIRRDPILTIQEYDSDVDLVSQDASNFLKDGMELKIDQGLYWSYDLKDLDDFRNDINLQNRLSKSGADQLAIRIDRNCLAAWSALPDPDNMGSTAGKISQDIDLGVAGTPRVITANDILEFVNETSQVLMEQDIPEEGKWLTMPAWMVTMFRNSDIKAANFTGDDTAVARSGVVGMVGGYTLIKSNNLPWDGVNKESTVMFGIKEALTFAMQITKERMGEREKRFASYFQGLAVFGRDAVQPTAFGTAIVKKG